MLCMEKMQSMRTRRERKSLKVVYIFYLMIYFLKDLEWRKMTDELNNVKVSIQLFGHASLC